jgi:hypothetical protein
MPKWKYCVVLADRDEHGWKARSVNGRDLRDWSKLDLYSFINRLGEDGWEMVTFSDVERPAVAESSAVRRVMIRAVFKKQK